MPRGRRRAEAELGVRDRKLDAGLRRARRKFKRFGSGAAKDLRRSFATVSGFAGLGTLALAGRQVFEFEKKLTRLGIQASKSPAEMAQVRRSIDQLSVASGISRDELLDVQAAFVSLVGASGLSEQALRTFARTAAASGSSAEDLARVAFSLSQNFGLSPAQFEQGFSILLSAGKQGSVELRQMASLLTTIAPSFTKFGRSGADGLAELAGAFQVVQSGFRGPDEAATALNGLFVSLTKNAAKFEQAGIKVFEVGADGVKRLRPFRTLVDDLANSELVRDPTKLAQAFGRAEAAKAFDELSKFRGTWDELTAASRGATDVAQDYNRFLQSSAGRTSRALARMRVSLANAMTPERIEMFANAMEHAAAAIELVANNLGIMLPLLAAAKFGPGLLGGIATVRDGGVSALLGGRGAKAGGAAAGGVGLGAAGLVAGAGAAGFALGTFADKTLLLSDRISDFLAGTDDTGKAGVRQAGKFDPTGEAALLRARASQIADQQPGLARSFRQRATAIERENFQRARARERRAFAFQDRNAEANLAGLGAVSRGASEQDVRRALRQDPQTLFRTGFVETVRDSSRQSVEVHVLLDDGLLEDRAQRRVRRQP